MTNNKIKSQEEIVRIRKKLREEGKRVATYNGSFDLLHVGHVRAIHEAKQQGDILIIALNSDKSVRRYKGPNRPIIPEQERADTIAALVDVDYITLFDEITVKEILEKIKPDIHCKSPDWGKNCVERVAVEEGGGKIHLLKWTEGRSTSDIVKKIIEVESKPAVKAVFLDRDGVINDNKDGYIHKREDFEFLPGVIGGLKKLSKTRFKIIIASNQSGIGRGMFTKDQFITLNNWMLAGLKDKGIRIDKVYFCPHRPDEGCDCRKPGIGMILKAAEEFALRLDKSWFVGDDDKDVQTGRNANLLTIKIGNKVDPALKLEPHYYANNFVEVVETILGKRT